MNDWRNALIPYLPESLERDLCALGVQETQSIRELRMRVGQKAMLCGDQHICMDFSCNMEELRKTVSAMLGHALHARGRELHEGFATLPGGHRAGFCGRMTEKGITEIRSICIRIAREIRGAAQPLRPWMIKAGKPQNLLIVSAPGCGKTTMLRDAARLLSEKGYQVCIADERSELAACESGKPQLDVGKTTDVMDGCEKSQAIRMMLRTMSPQVIVTDEIGSTEDAVCLQEISRCGVSLVGSLHGDCFEDAAERLHGWIACFQAVVLLGRIGEIRAVFTGKGEKIA